MDEPFSALDVLTAENLRGEIDDLWNAKNFPSKSILIVTHNIEEAVFLADRVIILGSNPGQIRGTAVDWGRYAELFEYDASEDRLYLPSSVLGESASHQQ